MRMTHLLAAAASALLATGPVAAQSGADLATSKGCATCHAPDAKKIGPSWKTTADKYKGNAAAADTLVAKLKEGKGHPKANASDAELKTLVGFVLAGGK